MLRYYGIYAKYHKQEKKLRKCLSPEKKEFLLRYLDWRNSILLSFGYDPLCCQKCGSSMLVLKVYHKKNCTIQTISKGHGIWIEPYLQIFLYIQIVQSNCCPVN